MTINIEELKRDREAGTDGPWHCDDGCDVRDQNGVMAGIVVTDTPEIDARRIARLPDLETAFLESVEILERCAKIVSRYNGRQNEKIDDVPYLVRQFLERNT